MPCLQCRSIVGDGFVQVMKGSCPQQGNSYDCGVYTILFAYQISQFINDRRDSISEVLTNNAELISNQLYKSVTPRVVTDYRDECIRDIRALAEENSTI